MNTCYVMRIKKTHLMVVGAMAQPIESKRLVKELERLRNAEPSSTDRMGDIFSTKEKAEDALKRAIKHLSIKTWVESFETYKSYHAEVRAFYIEEHTIY